ncbi:MAG: hypothetical protein QOJ19_3788 [Acidimicrobiia bacterium]|jgi:predicted transcriptional regulator|nr:hypothetical protein [Acidimicrobiia bacterium]
MTVRRTSEALEARILDYLWEQGKACTPAAVRDGLGLDVAYSTVMTILVRLWQNDMLSRQHVGRAFAYQPVITRADYASRRLAATLSVSHERAAALMHFVDTLSEEDVALLRHLLDQPRR